MAESSERRTDDDRPGRRGQRGNGHDERGAEDIRALYARAQAARDRSALLATRLQQTQQRASENWRLVRDAWRRAEQVRAGRLAADAAPGRLRNSVYARMHARLASLLVIEQAKGILMAWYGWPEEQAFEALRQLSQQRNIKVRELAASIVARAGERPASTPAPGRPHRDHRPADGPDDVGHFPAGRLATHLAGSGPAGEIGAASGPVSPMSSRPPVPAAVTTGRFE